jgi:hypothetical protein
VLSGPRKPRVSIKGSAAVDTLFSQVAAQQAAEATAKQVFQSVSRVLGLAEAQRIFGELAAQPPKRLQEELSRCSLLHAYILFRRKGWPLKKVARHLAEINKTLPIASKYGTRGYTEGAIFDQLYNLLWRRPPKQPSPLLRSLMEEASELPPLRRRKS